MTILRKTAGKLKKKQIKTDQCFIIQSIVESKQAIRKCKTNDCGGPF